MVILSLSDAAVTNQTNSRKEDKDLVVWGKFIHMHFNVYGLVHMEICEFTYGTYKLLKYSKEKASRATMK